jgi:hypothetical protein
LEHIPPRRPANRGERQRGPAWRPGGVAPKLGGRNRLFYLVRRQVSAAARFPGRRQPMAVAVLELNSDRVAIMGHWLTALLARRPTRNRIMAIVSSGNHRHGAPRRRYRDPRAAHHNWRRRPWLTFKVCLRGWSPGHRCATTACPFCANIGSCSRTSCKVLSPSAMWVTLEADRLRRITHCYAAQLVTAQQ